MGVYSRVTGLLAAITLILTMGIATPPAHAAVITASSLPGLLRIDVETTTPAYDRAKFKHWIDADGNGCDTRREVLISESLTPVGVTGNCELSGGKWFSQYDGVTTTNPSDFDIDHMVPLSEAWRSGASEWTDEQRRDFANDLDVDFSLIAVSASSNRSKGDRDPANWLPPNTNYTCEYITDWALTKYRWSLSIDQAEHQVVQQVLATDCGAQPVTLPAVMITPNPDEPISPPPSDPIQPVEPEVPSAAVIEAFGAGTTRLAGDNRFQTAIAASKKFRARVPAVFIATGADFPDALSASAAAATVGGPLLLTNPGSLPGDVLAEINRLQPERIYILGATGAVSRSVESTLAAVAPVTRLGGQSRYDTGLAIVENFFTDSSVAFVATGASFPDALAATGAAGKEKAPVILVDGTKPALNAETLRVLSNLGVRSIAIAGGTGVVSSGIERQLANNDFVVTRYGGINRYETAALINEAYFGPGSTDTLFLATGANFPDALAGAALAGQLSAPLFITTADCVPPVIHIAINALGASKTIIMGGTGVVGNSAAGNQVCVPKPPAPSKPNPVKPAPSKPKPVAPAPSKPSPGNTVSGYVSAGAFCAREVQNKFGYTKTGKLMKCVTTASDSRLRWRAA